MFYWQNNEEFCSFLWIEKYLRDVMISVNNYPDFLLLLNDKSMWILTCPKINIQDISVHLMNMMVMSYKWLNIIEKNVKVIHEMKFRQWITSLIELIQVVKCMPQPDIEIKKTDISYSAISTETRPHPGTRLVAKWREEYGLLKIPSILF